MHTHTDSGTQYSKIPFTGWMYVLPKRMQTHICQEQHLDAAAHPQLGKCTTCLFSARDVTFWMKRSTERQETLPLIMMPVYALTGPTCS